MSLGTGGGSFHNGPHFIYKIPPVEGTTSTLSETCWLTIVSRSMIVSETYN